MTATPLSMTEGGGHSLVHAKQIVQVHLLAMWAPSLVSGGLIRRFGAARLMGVGLAAYGICVAIGLAGRGLHHYGGALLLLGIGWSLLLLWLCLPSIALHLTAGTVWRTQGSGARRARRVLR